MCGKHPQHNGAGKPAARSIRVLGRSSGFGSSRNECYTCFVYVTEATPSCAYCTSADMLAVISQFERKMLDSCCPVCVRLGNGDDYRRWTNTAGEREWHRENSQSGLAAWQHLAMLLSGGKLHCHACFNARRSKSKQPVVRQLISCSGNGASKHTTIHKLIEQNKTLLIPGVHDALSAKVLAHTGHVSAFVSGYAVSVRGMHTCLASRSAFVASQ